MTKQRAFQAREFKAWINVFKDKKFWKSYALYLSFPLILAVIYAMFKDNPGMLNFDFGKLLPWTFYTHSFFHNNWQHLQGNMQAYVVLIALNLIVLYKNRSAQNLIRISVFHPSKKSESGGSFHH